MSIRIPEPTLNTVEQARLYTRRYATTFYFASHVLPPDKRDAAYAVYAFCRYADNIADAGGTGLENAHDAARQLVLLRRELDALYGDGVPGARWLALRDTIDRFGIPRRYFLELLDGVSMDLSPRPLHTFEELHTYCYHVASVVGLIMCYVFEATSDEALEYAADLGTAMQLTNILRDIGEDCAMGRTYLPRDEMLRHGISEESLARGTVDSRFRTFMAFQIERARSYYQRAEPGIALVPPDGSRFCVTLMRTLYAGILDRIERNDYDVFRRRARVSLLSKILQALRIGMRGGQRSGWRHGDRIRRPGPGVQVHKEQQGVSHEPR